ncbi:MAG: hypothetical protein Tsb009_35620 [Planctomycetaceae bacterium]
MYPQLKMQLTDREKIDLYRNAVTVQNSGEINPILYDQTLINLLLEIWEWVLVSQLFEGF